MQVATTEADEHHISIILMMVSAKPGGWRVDAGSVPAAAVVEMMH